MIDIYKQAWHSHSCEPDIKNGRATFTINDKILELELDDFLKFKEIGDFLDAVIKQTFDETKKDIHTKLDRWLK